MHLLHQETRAARLAGDPEPDVDTWQLDAKPNLACPPSEKSHHTLKLVILSAI